MLTLAGLVGHAPPWCNQEAFHPRVLQLQLCIEPTGISRSLHQGLACGLHCGWLRQIKLWCKYFVLQLSLSCLCQPLPLTRCQ
mmetsp:Transcript_4693/g.15501  ORF Transcript_4693/g.15501 Transcript_4693/m.15501 type:complete len:83 (+) Transcript_4693:353-601(+)